MTIILGELTIGVWQVELPRGMGGNLFAHMGYIEAGKPRIRMDVRFRWYRDEIVEAHLSRDRRSYWRVETDDPPATAIEKFRAVIASLRHASGGSSWELLRGGRTSEEFVQELAKMPGMHVGNAMTDQELRDIEEPGPLEPEVPAHG